MGGIFLWVSNSFWQANSNFWAFLLEIVDFLNSLVGQPYLIIHSPPTRWVVKNPGKRAIQTRGIGYNPAGNTRGIEYNPAAGLKNDEIYGSISPMKKTLGRTSAYISSCTPLPYSPKALKMRRHSESASHIAFQLLRGFSTSHRKEGAGRGGGCDPIL